jgi:hypothetical protein
MCRLVCLIPQNPIHIIQQARDLNLMFATLNFKHLFPQGFLVRVAVAFNMKQIDSEICNLSVLSCKLFQKSVILSHYHGL